MTNKCNRVIGLDILRFTAVFFVLSVHFFLNNGFYQFPVSGKRIFIMINMRWLFYCCVPLFMLLTGYLQNRKTLAKYNFKAIYPILTSYIFISVITIIFRINYLKHNLSFGDIIESILNFTGAPYSWYIEMYIGFFFLIPFINMIYHGLESKKQKLLLITIMLLLTSIPSLANSIDTADSKFQVLSHYWTELYPFTYYFIGAYLSEYRIKMKKSINLALIFIIVLIESTLTFFHYYGTVFSWNFLEGYNSFLTLSISVLIFILLYDLEIKSESTKFIISDFSKAALDIYLISYVFDSIIYPYVKNKISFIPEMLPYYFIIVPLVFLLSYIFAVMKRIIFEFIIRFVVKLKYLIPR